MSRVLQALALLGLVAVGAPPARAQTPESQPTGQPPPPAPPIPAAHWYDALRINAFVSSSYVFNFNRPPPAAGSTAGVNQLRVYDVLHNSITLDVAEVVVQKLATAPGDWGFRVDLTAGTTIPPISASAGLTSLIQQAYVSWIAPNKLRLDVGKFVSFVGPETIEGFDGWNDNFSRSFTFGFGTPSTLTGIRLTYPFSDKVGAAFYLVNGWDVSIDNNDWKSFGLQLALTPSDRVTLYFNALVGGESPSDDDQRLLGDVVAIVRPGRNVTLSFDGLIGWEDRAVFFGLTGYARFDFTPAVGLALRAEWFGDPDGFRFGVPGGVNLVGLTVTPFFSVANHIVIRPEVRLDIATEDVFVDHDGVARPVQVTIALNLLAYI